MRVAGQVRIVGGAWRRRLLPVASGPGVPAGLRPTPDRVRETLFNWLGQDLGGWHCVDLCAGTGALGLEALSRGARFALFVDEGAEARALLRANIESLGAAGLTRIFRRDATKLGLAPPGGKFDLAFLDPPYGRDLAPRALASLLDGGWLNEGALCVIEEAAGAALDLPPGLAALERRDYGDTQIVIARCER